MTYYSMTYGIESYYYCQTDLPFDPESQHDPPHGEATDHAWMVRSYSALFFRKISRLGIYEKKVSAPRFFHKSEKNIPTPRLFEPLRFF